MNKRIKVLSVIIALLILISAFTFSVCATDIGSPAPGTGDVSGGDGSGGNSSGGETPGGDTPGGDTSGGDTPGGDTPGGDTPGGDTPGGDTPGGDTPGTDTPGGDTPGTDTPGSDTPGTVNPGGNTGGYVGGDDFYYFDEDEMVNSIEQSADSVSDSTKLYDTSDLNEAALKETKWDDIVLNTSKPNSDALDFSAIKKDTRKDDDGQWIFYTGFVLIAFSIIGIMYYIIATSTYKKKLRAFEDNYYNSTSRPRDDYGDYDNYPPQRTHRQHKRYAADGLGYAERKRLKADTAEINLPSEYNARH